MNLNKLIFINNLPKVDVHGLDEISANMYIDDFINENYLLNQEYIVIIHGMGTGILRKMATNALQNHEKVADFKLWHENIGCTVVQLKIDS